MTTEDAKIVEDIVQFFKLKEITPKRGNLLLIIKDGRYQYQNPDRVCCAIGAILATNKASSETIDDLTPFQDAAEIINLPVAVTMGIAFGFDLGDGARQVGPEDARGIAIGRAVADQMFIKPKKFIS